MINLDTITDILSNITTVIVNTIGTVTGLKQLKKYLRKRSYKKLSEQLDSYIKIVLPDINTLFEESYQIIKQKYDTVLKAGGVFEINSTEFKAISIQFLDTLKIVGGSKIYDIIIDLWEDENLFKEYALLWLYYRILGDSVNILKQTINYESMGGSV